MKRIEIIDLLKNHTVTFNFENCDGDYRRKYGLVTMITDVKEFLDFNPKELFNILLELADKNLVPATTEENEMLSDAIDYWNYLSKAEDSFHGKYIDLPRLYHEASEAESWYKSHPSWIFGEKQKQDHEYFKILIY